MSGIGNWLWGTSQLDDAVDKATSELVPAGSEDIALNLEICDQIRSKSVVAKDAMRALKRRLNHKNPNVQNLALGLTDICVKNGGDHFLVEIASREFMDNLVSILKIPTLNLEVKNNILRLVQNWSVAFEGKPALSYLATVYKTLTNEGYKFPPKDLAVANSVMVDTTTAPEWIDSDVCLRCRTAFTFTNRKHHCRNCGLVFDQACSSKSMPLPHFGITQDVRVCEGCYSKLTKKTDKNDKGHHHSSSMYGSRHRSARDLADAELQRAIQLSLQEVGAANGARPGYVPTQPSPTAWQQSEPPIIDHSSRPTAQPAEEEDDPDLKAAIEASLREANAPKPSAPIALEAPQADSYTGPGYSQSYPPAVLTAPPAQPSYELEPLESDAILTFSQTIEQVEAQGGRDMSRYPAVNELYDKANSLRPKLALSLDDAGRKEQMLSDMHDKLSQAVKLYDKLLTEQVAYPRWRPQVVTSTGYRQAGSSYSTSYSHNQQWASPVPTTNGYHSEQPRQQQLQQPQSPQMVYSSPPLPPVQEQQTQYGTQQQQSPQQQFGHYPQYADTHQQLDQTSQQQPVPQQLPPVSLNLQQYPYYYPPSSSSPPRQATQSPPASVLAPSSPPTQYSSPPLQPISDLSPPSSSPALARHNTLSYAQSPGPPPTNAHAHMARSNTMGPYAAHQTRIRQQTLQRQHAQQRHQQSQNQQFQQAPVPPSGLPQFPVAPTSAPQAFPLYGPSGVPVGIGEAEAPERKEALLIDL